MSVVSCQYGVFYERYGIVSNIGQYILSVLAAAIISSIVLRIAGKGHMAPVMKLLCGIFLVCTAVAPWLEIRTGDLNLLIESYSLEADSVVDAGLDDANKEMQGIIKHTVESYISTKAIQFNTTVEAEVIMSDDNPLLPESAKITGVISPHAKRSMIQYIANELGIPEEKQLWF